MFIYMFIFMFIYMFIFGCTYIQQKIIQLLPDKILCETSDTSENQEVNSGFHDDTASQGHG